MHMDLELYCLASGRNLVNVSMTTTQTHPTDQQTSVVVLTSGCDEDIQSVEDIF